MKQFEYKVVGRGHEVRVNEHDFLNELGLKHWELVSVVVGERELRYILKREVVDKTYFDLKERWF